MWLDMQHVESEPQRDLSRLCSCDDPAEFATAQRIRFVSALDLRMEENFPKPDCVAAPALPELGQSSPVATTIVRRDVFAMLARTLPLPPVPALGIDWRKLQIFSATLSQLRYRDLQQGGRRSGRVRS